MYMYMYKPQKGKQLMITIIILRTCLSSNIACTVVSTFL